MPVEPRTPRTETDGGAKRPAKPKLQIKTAWEFAVYALATPRIWIAVLCVVAGTYTLLRVAGYDVLPSALAKIGITPIKSRFDIAGRWTYSCTVFGEKKPGWGGTMSVRAEPTTAGVEWRIAGQREWELDPEHPGTTRRLPTGIPWESKWALVTSDGALKFCYIITKETEIVEGFAEGEIESAEGKPVKIVGRFHQLAPASDVNHGKMEITR